MGSPGTTWLQSDVIKHPVLNMIAEKLGKTPAQVSLRWGLQMGHSVLPKSTNEARIKENFDLFDWAIPEDLFAKFSEIQQVKCLMVSVGLSGFKNRIYYYIDIQLQLLSSIAKIIVNHLLPCYQPI